MKALMNEKAMIGKTVKAVKSLEMKEEERVKAHALAIVFDDETVAFVQGDDPYDGVSVLENGWEIERCMKEVRREERKSRRDVQR